jgi:hypothetical protein
MVNEPDTELAALKPVAPGCDAVIMQLPVPLRVTVADETPPSAIDSTDWLPLAMEQGPVALKFTCKPFAVLFDMAVAVMGCGPGRTTELGKEPSTIVWLFVSTAGTEGGLWRCVGSIATGSRVVPIV